MAISLNKSKGLTADEALAKAIEQTERSAVMSQMYSLISLAASLRELAKKR